MRNDKEVATWVAGAEQGHRRLSRDAAGPRHLQGADQAAVRLRALRRAAQEGRALFLHPQQRAAEPGGAVRPRQRWTAPGRVLIDPNAWAKDGATALAEWAPRDDGKLLVYAHPGRRHRLAHGQGARRRHRQDRSDDEVKWVKFSATSPGRRTDRGFYYSRFPAPAAGADLPGAQREPGRSISTSSARRRSADTLVYATPDNPEARPLRAGDRRRQLAGHHHLARAPTTAMRSR